MLQGRKKGRSGLSVAKLNIDGVDVTNPSEMTEEFNNYFCHVGADLANKLQNQKKNSSYMRLIILMNITVCDEI